MIGRQVVERFLAVAKRPLLHQGRCEEGFLESGQSIQGLGIGEQDVMRQTNHTERGEIGELGV
jgi:hypothetical protein